MGAGLVFLGLLGLAALAAGSSGRRRGISSQTRDRVRDTLATSDNAARTMPVDTVPAVVDPDRRTGSSASTTTSTTPSGGGSAWARSRDESASGADMTFRVDANGRYPGEPGYIDPDAAPSGTPASMHVIPPTTAEDHGSEGDGATERPTVRNPDEARRLAAGTANAIRTTASGWRNRLRAFQRAAGIPVDGRYGGLSYNALVYYGIRNPPPARSAPRPTAPEANYVDRVIAAGSSVAGWSRR